MSASHSTSPLAAAADEPARFGLGARACVLALTLFLEKLFLNGLVSFRAAQAATGLGAAARILQHFGFRFAVSFAIAIALFVYVSRDDSLATINGEARLEPVRLRWVALHCALLVPIGAALYNLYGTHGVHLPFAILGASAVLLTAVAVAALLSALAPWRIWGRAAAAIGHRWIYALAAAFAATLAIVFSQDLWTPTARITFDLVRLVLTPFLPTLQADAATLSLYAPHFAVQVSQVCSGLEGVGLILAFSIAWLVFFREEYRFPRALLLIPAGVLLVFALNVLRIAALVLIGNAGHPNVAIFGFHSQAGWISFNAVACGLVLISRGSRWLQVAPAAPPRSAAPDGRSRADNPTAAYLLPFLAVLAAGMLSRAISGRFETWYALRLLAGGAALAVSYPRLSGLDWRFSWRAAAAGLVAFGIWLGASRLLLPAQILPHALATTTPALRALWIAGHAATSVLVLPFAEELAYRGYLLRRLVAADFESVSFAAVGWIPVLLTSVLYGMLDGPLWPAGVAVGIVFALLLTRTRRMGEAVTAHIIANTLVAVSVLIWHQWQLW